jgi:N-acetylglucosamine-6-sulfatase
VTATAVVAATVGFALAVQSSPPADAAAARGGDRPNIILIVTDDQTLAQLNRKTMPATDRLLVDRGSSFSRFYASTAQCCPSRAAMLTGQYGHNNGVLSNQDGYAGLIRKRDTLPAWLRRAGYRTAHVGKYLNGYTDVAPPGKVAPGWSEWHTIPNPGYYDYLISDNGRLKHHGTAKSDYLTTVLNRLSVRVIGHLAPQRRPFYLQLDHRAPHTDKAPRGPGRCTGFALPAPGDAGRFKRAALPRKPSFNEAGMSDKPSFLRRLDRLSKSQVKRTRRKWGCALASLRGIDRGVRRIVSALQDLGEARRTAILFTSDNGLFYGEHRIKASKVLPYEEAERLPLVMRVPRRYRDFQPRVPRLGQVAANVDLAPTILDLADAAPCSTCRVMDGRSLLDLINGNASRWPDDRGILLEWRVRHASHHATCHYTAIHTGHRLYVEHTRLVRRGRCVEVDERELYDLTFDPFQLENLCARGCPNGPGQEQLEERLATLRGCEGIAGRDPVPPSGYCE